MDKNIVANSIKNAKRLMSDPNFNAKVNGYVNDGAGSDGYMPSMSSRPQTVEEAYDPMDYTQRSGAINTKLPKQILDSMLNNPINVTPSSAGFGSVLDGMDTGELERSTPAPVQRRKLNETVMPQQQVPMMQPAGFDSNYLKFLVKEAVKECMDDMKKELLNETTVRGFKVGNGNKLMLVDNKGNLYEGEMKLKKKAQ